MEVEKQIQFYSKLLMLLILLLSPSFPLNTLPASLCRQTRLSFSSNLWMLWILFVSYLSTSLYFWRVWRILKLLEKLAKSFDSWRFWESSEFTKCLNILLVALHSSTGLQRTWSPAPYQRNDAIIARRKKDTIDSQVLQFSVSPAWCTSVSLLNRCPYTGAIPPSKYQSIILGPS